MEQVHRMRAFLQEFSIPLLIGVVVAMIAANVAPHWYHAATEWMPLGHATLLGHEITLHFLVNDIFMVFFFGIAAKEITEACLPGGALNPIRKAVNPLMATLGGVLGPIATFFVGLAAFRAVGLFPADAVGIERGWGVPTATDIALAWLVARAVFGAGHPAVAFLLLLAVADDAIGLGIIAVFYGDPAHPAEPAWLGLVLAGMALAFGLRKMGVKNWTLYVFGAGPLAWSGLVLAHLHPALALVFVVPFLPGPSHDDGLFVDDDDHHTPLEDFEHTLKAPVDFGLFLFAFVNAGVALSGVGPMTALIALALVVGKTVGVSVTAYVAHALGFALPKGMGFKEVVMTGFVAALGLTVALFVAGAAFVDPVLQGEAKMGALFSGFVGIAAVVIARMIGIRRIHTAVPASEEVTEVIVDRDAA